MYRRIFDLRKGLEILQITVVQYAIALMYNFSVAELFSRQCLKAKVSRAITDIKNVEHHEKKLRNL